MLLRFFLYFTCSVLIYTLAAHIFVIVWFLILAICEILWRYFRSINSLIQPILLLFFWVIVAWVATYSTNIRNTTFTSTALESWSQALSGTIVQWLKNNDYVLDTIFGEILLRKSEEQYQYWQRILISGYFSKIDIDRQWWLFVKNLSIPSFLLWEFDYNMRLWTKWYVGDLYSSNGIILPKITKTEWVLKDWGGIQIFTTYLNNINMRLFEVRQTIKDRVTALYSSSLDQSLLLGMLTWDISRMTKSEYQLFVDANLVHLVAVSGGNLIMLVIFLNIFFFWLPYKVRMLFILLWLAGYVLLVWSDTSVLRAFVMWGLALAALLLGRISSVWRLLMFAWIILLCINPYALFYDLWFILSFSALSGILLFQKFIHTLINFDIFSQKTQKFLDEYLIVNLWASLWVFPFLIFFVWSMNILWFIGNIFVLPLVPLVMVFWWLSLMLDIWFLSKWLIYWTELLLLFITKVAEFSRDLWLYLSSEWSAKLLFFVFIFSLYFFVYYYFTHFLNNIDKQEIDLY